LRAEEFRCLLVLVFDATKFDRLCTQHRSE
jgi:hypothetical protein